MNRSIVLLFFALAVCDLATAGSPLFDGEPRYADDESRRIALRLVEAHGGRDGWRDAESLSFRFVTKVIGAPVPWYSIETMDLRSNAAYIDWPWWDAKTGFDGEAVWSENWKMPLPAGFFTRLTASFITLPWLTGMDGVTVGPVTTDRLPGSETRYRVLRLEFAERGPQVPGEYYELFIDPDRHVMRAVRFNITHPGMVANPNQPLGPNLHVFQEYRQIEGLIFPTYYTSYGRNAANATDSSAIHMLFDLSLERPFDVAAASPPPAAERDEVTRSWWQQADAG